MVQAWFMDDSTEDKRLPHQLDPPQPVTLQELENIHLLYFHIDIDDNGDYKKDDAPLAVIKKERGYTYDDEITVSREKLPNYDEKLKIFFDEHLHTDEEIRLILDGRGYFDVRNTDDRWIRVLVEKGDLLILPAGIYHRFTLDTSDFIVAKRLFVGEPIWTPHKPCEGDALPARAAYVQSIKA